MPHINFKHDKGFFSVKEFCNWASIGTTTFYKLVKEGKIRRVKIGTKTLVSSAEAHRFAASLIETANDNIDEKGVL